MKKLHLCLISTLLAASMHAQSIDYTKGLSIWFDKPNNLDGRHFKYRRTGLLAIRCCISTCAILRPLLYICFCQCRDTCWVGRYAF